jgi:hypothetical protein
MPRYTTAFVLGFLACAFAVLIILDNIEIPEYTVIYQFEVEEKSCAKDRWIRTVL